MATSATLYQINGRYYTAAGKEDYYAENPDSTHTATEITATRYTVTVRAMDSNSCTIWLATPSGGDQSGRRTINGVSETYSRKTGAGPVLTWDIYKRNSSGSFVYAYGAHPAHPGNCHLYTSVGCAVKVVTNNESRYNANVAYIVDVASPDSFAGNRESGSYNESTQTSPYDAGKIVYDNSSGKKLIWFGANVSLDKEFAVYCGFFWFYALAASSGVEWGVPNVNTRTVANGKKWAFVTDIEDYCAGSNSSLSTKQSSGSLTFTYRVILRQGLGNFLNNYSGRILGAWSGQTTGGDAVVLRSVNTKSDGSGTTFRVGDDISEILTRRPSLTGYDTRVTLYPTYARRFEATVVANGGTGTSAFYYCPEEGSFFSDEAMAAQIAALSPYTKQSAQFLGLYTTDSSAGEKAVNADGTFVEGWAPEGDCTLYAQWRTVVEISLDAAGGTGGTTGIWYDSGAGGFVLPNGTDTIASIVPPTIECFGFLGYFSAEAGGTKLIDGDGALLSSLTATPPASATTLYAQWERVSWKMSLDACGGSGGDVALYCDGEAAAFFRDDKLENEVDMIELPERVGHNFLGFYTLADGGTQCIDAAGGIVMQAFSENGTLYAQWSPKTYTVTFDYGIGSGSEETRTVTWNVPIGTLPSVTPPVAAVAFGGWLLDGAEITATTPWLKDADSVVVAKWVGEFGDVTDYFGLASGALIPFRSDSGDNRQRIAVRHYGKFDGGDRNSITWRNPTVSYMVVRDMSLAVHLGKAFPAQSGVTGYMMTEVSVETAIGEFPVVTVVGVANEGANAINDFSVTVDILARARPQALLGSVQENGGSLQSLSLAIACDPVVVAEGMAPVASDVVNGRLTVDASVRASITGTKPSVSGGFEELGIKESGGGTEYTMWHVSAGKEL